MPSVLVIDPGGATGVSLWVGSATKPYLRQSYHLVQGKLRGFKEWADVNEGLIRTVQTVVCEDFIIDGRTPKPDLTPVWIGGLVYDRRPDAVWQPNTAKNTKTNDPVLKAHDLWVTGKDVNWEDGRDVNDTGLHALAWMKATKHVPSIKHYWPEA